jgi:hypothetical protein
LFNGPVLGLWESAVLGSIVAIRRVQRLPEKSGHGLQILKGIDLDPSADYGGVGLCVLDGLVVGQLIMVDVQKSFGLGHSRARVQSNGWLASPRGIYLPARCASAGDDGEDTDRDGSADFRGDVGEPAGHR